MSFRGGVSSKSGQVTIFIIIAIVIVVIFIAFFLLRGNLGILDLGSSETNPNSFMRNCLEENLREGMELISSQGGYINRTLSTELDGRRIAFLCYTSSYYYPCKNQEPVLIQHLEKELKTYVSNGSGSVEECFNSLEESLEKKSFEVSKNFNDFEIVLERGKVSLEVDGEISATKSESTTSEDDIGFSFPSKFYDLSTVVHEIANQEARFCNFDVEGFRLFYPEFKITKFRTSDLSIVYTIEHEQTQEEFKFAVRGCVIPPGL